MKKVIPRVPFVLGLWLLVLLLPAVFLYASDTAELKKPETLILAGIVGDTGKTPIKWKENWAKDNGAGLTETATLALKVATNPELDRTRLRAEIKYGGDTVKAAPRNLDVGRHDLLKSLMSRACARANARLESEGLSRLERATTVNSGGTGDFTRDVDVTVFGGDSVRETYLFEAIVAEAGVLGLKCDPDPVYGVKAGLNFPQIEVAFHRGNNDLPDARFCADVQTFAADYRRVVQNQAKNPEAYFGYGFEVEVQGRRSLSFKPGQTLVQDFTCEPGKPVQYKGQIAASQREVRAILQGAIGQRYRRAQNASHITNHFLQAFRHEQGTDHDLTKGALKYAGRSVEALCEYYGMKNWPDLIQADRIALLKNIFPAGYGEKANELATLEHMAQSLDVAYLTFVGKKVPGKVGNEEVADATQDAERCMRFMQKAVATTASSVAEEMLHPPSFNPKFLEEAAKQTGKPWDMMNAEERNTFAMKADENYKKCCSIAAMENLLCIVQQVRQLDLPEYNKKGGAPGKEALTAMLQTADEKTRPILELAIDHAEAAVAVDSATDPVRKKLAQERLNGYRKQMEKLTGKSSAGETVVQKAASIDVPFFVDSVKTKKAYPLGEDIAELRRRFSEHIDEAFPPTDIAAFRAHLREVGVKSYVFNKMVHEVASPATAMDVISLIEIYQNGGGKGDLAKAAGISLVNRGHWSLGFLIQAGQVRSESDVVELGKNVVFDAFTRIVPGVGQFKLAFDIEKGLVNITVGYTINQLNADLIDALYTGEAGRVNDGTAGKVAGRLRDSGFCVLDGKYVKQETDETTKKVSVVVQKVDLYEDSFRKFTGRDPYDKNTPTGERRAAAVTRSHDELLRHLENQASSAEPAWFGQSTNVKPSQEMIEAAMTSYHAALLEFTRPAVQGVLSESAVRQYMQNGKDQIEEGLVARYTQDILTGTISAWQTHQIERNQARREVESSANFADMNQFASSMVAETFKARNRSKEKAEYTLDVRLPGGGLDAEMDGDAPVPVQFALRSNTEAPVNVGDVFYEVVPGKISPPDNGKEYVAGEILTQEYLAKAVCGSEVLAQAEFMLRVRVPEPKPEGAKLLDYEGKDENGKVWTRYTYYDRDAFKKAKMSSPKPPKTDGNKIIHGNYVEYDYQGKVKQEDTYSYGYKNGLSKWYDSGYMAADTEWVMDREVKHTCYYPDGTKNWDMEYNEKSQMISHKLYWGEGDKIMEHMSVSSINPENMQSGVFERHFSNGNLSIHSEFLDAPIGTLLNKETIESYRNGPWVSNWKSGQAMELGQTVKAVMVGRWQTFLKDGKPESVTTYDDKGKALDSETWSYYENGNLQTHVISKDKGKDVEKFENYENGNLKSQEHRIEDKLNGAYAKGNEAGVITEKGNYVEDLKEGLWVSKYENGDPSQELTYSQGQQNGAYINYQSGGKVLSRGSFKDGLHDGKWENFNPNGTPSETGAYKADMKEGVWVYCDEKGKRSYWEEYKKGDVVKRGNYDVKK